MRFNEGKPELTYWYSTRFSYMRCINSLDQDAHTAREGIAQFLRRETDDLTGVVRILVACIGPDFKALYSAVCVRGEAKYYRGNFRLGQSVCHYLDSALRHLDKLLDLGEDTDPESRMPHLVHALWNVIEAAEQPAFRDDRLPLRAQEPAPPADGNPGGGPL